MKEFFKRDLSFYVVLIIFVALIVFNYGTYIQSNT